MKLNNKGFAISSVMYIILVMGVILIALTLSIMGSRKLMIDKLKDEALDNIYKVCTLVSGKPNKIGSKYICEVKTGTKYNFYVISHNDDGTTNLIMDRNICNDGTLATSANTCYVQWNSSGYNSIGPRESMYQLYNGTKDWINIPALNYEYMDREYQGIPDDNTTAGYTSFISINGVATITPLSGTVISTGTSDKPLRARMPIYSSEPTKTEVSDKKSDNSNAYLYENLEYGIINGYWTLSTSTYNNNVFTVHVSGMIATMSISSYYMDYDPLFGVRPVIAVKL